MRLILVRHGETHLNRDGRIQGINETSLDEVGKSQARAVAKALSRDLPFQLYASPIARARETAQIISQELGVQLKTVAEFREADAGELEGLTGAEMRERYPEFAERWAEDAGTAQMPGGESLAEVQDRAWQAVSRISGAHGEGTIVVVSHNFVIQTIVCKLLEAPLKHSRRLRQDLGSITRLDLNGSQWTVASLNETAHLEPPSSVAPAQ